MFRVMAVWRQSWDANPSIRTLKPLAISPHSKCRVLTWKGAGPLVRGVSDLSSQTTQGWTHRGSTRGGQEQASPPGPGAEKTEHLHFLGSCLPTTFCKSLLTKFKIDFSL